MPCTAAQDIHLQLQAAVGKRTAVYLLIIVHRLEHALLPNSESYETYNFKLNVT